MRYSEQFLEHIESVFNVFARLSCAMKQRPAQDPLQDTSEFKWETV